MDESQRLEVAMSSSEPEDLISVVHNILSSQAASHADAEAIVAAKRSGLRGKVSEVPLQLELQMVLGTTACLSMGLCRMPA